MYCCDQNTNLFTTCKVKTQRGVEVHLSPFLTCALNGVGGHHHGPAALPPRRGSNSHFTEVGWTPGPNWKGVHKKSLVYTGVRTPKPPVRGVVSAPTVPPLQRVLSSQ